jgi:hypothetical protein
MYEIVQDFYLQEQGIQLEVGVQFADGDLDPDVIAQLLSSGIIVDLTAESEPALVEPEDEPSEDAEE